MIQVLLDQEEIEITADDKSKVRFKAASYDGKVAKRDKIEAAAAAAEARVAARAAAWNQQKDEENVRTITLVLHIPEEACGGYFPYLPDTHTPQIKQLIKTNAGPACENVNSNQPRDERNRKQSKVLFFLRHAPMCKFEDINWPRLRHLFLIKQWGLLNLYMPEPKLKALGLRPCCWMKDCKLHVSGRFCNANYQAQIDTGLRQPPPNFAAERERVKERKRKQAEDDRLEANKAARREAEKNPPDCGRFKAGKCCKYGPTSPGRVACRFMHREKGGDPSLISCISATRPRALWIDGKNPCEFNEWPEMQCPYAGHVTTEE
jgi:hypothetical protein